ncbi:unnamed protein product [Calypogeia fissa]
MSVTQYLVCPLVLSLQPQLPIFSPSNCRPAAAAAQLRTSSSPLTRKHDNSASLVKKCVRLQERGSRSLHLRRGPALPIRAISSTGPLVGDESWGQDGEDGLNSEDAKKEVVKEKKKRIIAGVDQTQLLEPHLLADPDSRFAEYHGVQIHYKICRPGTVSDAHSPPAVGDGAYDQTDKQKVNIPGILLHGFGASLFSWERVMPKVAEILGAAVIAFDRPAFGFTSRTFPPSSSASSDAGKESLQKYKNAYTVAFSAAATLAFIDFLKSDQAIVIGHSAGSLVAVDAYFQAPEKIAALILVAPALVAPFLMQQIADSKKAAKEESKLEVEIKSDRTDSLPKFRAALLWIWLKFIGLLTMVKKFVQLVLSKLLGFLFRSPPAVWLVRRIMDTGGPWAVRYAFYDVLKADKYVLDGYTRPLQCRDWERALLEYCLALVDKTDEEASGKKKLQDVKCPVLVVTGDTDRIVPDWNSENLAKVFPNAEFKRIKNCGHLPHEETTDEFLQIIEDWLARTLIKNKYTMESAMSS